MIIRAADIGGAEGPTAEERAKLEEEERERLLALQEAEELRKEKHRKLEEEREKMRQGVREKVSSAGDHLRISTSIQLTHLARSVQHQKEGRQGGRFETPARS